MRAYSCPRRLPPPFAPTIGVERLSESKFFNFITLWQDAFKYVNPSVGPTDMDTIVI